MTTPMMPRTSPATAMPFILPSGLLDFDTTAQTMAAMESGMPQQNSAVIPRTSDAVAVPLLPFGGAGCG